VKTILDDIIAGTSKSAMQLMYLTLEQCGGSIEIPHP